MPSAWHRKDRGPVSLEVIERHNRQIGITFPEWKEIQMRKRSAMR